MNDKKMGWVRALLIIIPFLVVSTIFQFIGIIVSGVSLSDLLNNVNNRSEYQETVIQIFSLIATIVITWLFVKYLDKEKYIDIGLSLNKKILHIVSGLILGTVIMILAYYTLIGLNEIELTFINVNTKKIIYSVILFTAVAFSEEILVRGYVLKNLMYSVNKYLALLLSSILFSLMHAANPNINLISFINIFLAGLLLGIVYIHTKNLWFAIALHLSWNLCQSLIGFNVSGQDFYSIINFKIIKSNTFNGGNFGFEGSYFASIIMIILIVAIDVFYRSKQRKCNVNP